MSLEGSSLKSTCIDSSWRSAAFSSCVFEKTGGCHPAVSSTGADITWLLRPLLKPRGSLRTGGRHEEWAHGGCKGVARGGTAGCRVRTGRPARRGTGAQGGRVLLDEVVPHEPPRRSVVEVVLHHLHPPPARAGLCGTTTKLKLAPFT